MRYHDTDDYYDPSYKRDHEIYDRARAVWSDVFEGMMYFFLWRRRREAAIIRMTERMDEEY